MDIVTWILAGGFLGWAGYAFMQMNRERGPIVSVVIGAVGGIVGGKVIAPLFVAATAAPDAFNPDALLFAAAIAAACVAAGSFVHARWGV